MKFQLLNTMQFVSLLLVLSFALSSSLAATSIANQKAGTGVHLPVGKDGEGEYTAATKGCFDVIDVTTPLILEQIKQQPARPFGSPAFHIADYGTADAGTSLGLLTKMVEGVRSRDGESEKEVVIHYEDQLTNEWQVSTSTFIYYILYRYIHIHIYILCKYAFPTLQYPTILL
jgi:hypothetical protein